MAQKYLVVNRDTVHTHPWSVVTLTAPGDIILIADCHTEIHAHNVADAMNSVDNLVNAIWPAGDPQ